MPSPKLFRLSAVAGLVSALLFFIGPFLTYAGRSRITVFGLGSVLLLFWLTGTYMRQRKEIGTLGFVGYVLFTPGVLYWLLITFIVNPNIICALGAVNLLTIWGAIAYGTATLETGVFPRGATVLWMVGLVMIALSPWPISAYLAGAGMIWSSCVLWSTGRGVDNKPVIVTEAPAKGNRLLELDVLRGLIMVLMAIDHVSAMIRRSHPFEYWNMLLPHYQNAWDFLTRFVTHFCAPGFFFLMGVGMMLFTESRRQLGWSVKRIALYIAVRGILLIALEKLILHPLWYGALKFTEFGVLYGLGGAMIVCILFLRFNRIALLAIGLGTILLTQILPYTLEKPGDFVSPLIRLFLVPGSTGDWHVLYPVLPWMGMTVIGMLFGTQLLRDREKACRRALICGVISLLIFPIVRGVGGFGNFQPAAGSGWIDFLNLVKYPPSLVFTLLTLGANLIFLSLFARTKKTLEKWAVPLLIFGQTALFFYFAHWFVYASISWNFRLLFRGTPGLSLMYLGWGVGLLLLYPVCRRFADFKQRTAPGSIWRLF